MSIGFLKNIKKKLVEILLKIKCVFVQNDESGFRKVAI